MRKACCLFIASVLIVGATSLRSQQCAGPVAGSATIILQTGPRVQCTCTFSIPGSGSTQDVFWIPQPTSCCGVTVTSYYDGGSCVVVDGKLDRPAIERLLEFAQTHELLTAKCDGQYFPAKPLLRSKSPEISLLSLNSMRTISDLGAR
jgi:hypothetical protein